MASCIGDYRVCETPGCNAPSKLQCPTCVKLGIQGSFFCSQECFKSNWKTHKMLHKFLQGKEREDSNNLDAESYNPWPFYKYSGRLRPYPQAEYRTVPQHIPRPDYADHIRGHPLSEQKLKNSSQIQVLNDDEIEGMRTACKILYAFMYVFTSTRFSPSTDLIKLGREVLEEAAKIIGVGVTTDEIDRVVHEACLERECYPSPLNYYQFPRSCCTSVNEVICHGIPDLRPLKDGDICNVDVTVYHQGFHGDLNETFFIGKVSETAKNLVNVTWECLSKAMDIVKPGEKYREIGNVIQKHAQANNFSVVRSYCGHGIHQLFHTAPSVPHYAKNKAVGVMKAGHCFTIEPMISEGSWRDEMWPDNWTAVTIDGLLSAQFEHTLLVTDNGLEVLTQRPGRPLPHFLDPL